MRTSPAERRVRFGLLLAAIAAVFAVQGISEPGRLEEVGACALLAATLVLSLRVASVRPRVMHVGMGIAVVLVVLAIVEGIVSGEASTAVRVANLLLVTLCPPAVTLGVIRTLQQRNRVTVEAVLGVLSLYLLIGLFFAALYAVIGRVGDGFFADGVATTASRCVYFSFTTLTTVGYGDLTASSNLGHTLSVSEALVGQIYLVTVVSLIVGNLGRSRQPPTVGEPRP